ncbi:MAG: flagellar export chaperone FlgN [Firmicutes bacterium]|nr:flagellar export chaperone FlgN [Bacillota bacterium]
MTIQEWMSERDFVSLLEDELNLLERLSLSARKKKSALVSNDIKSLSEIVLQEEKEIHELQKFEARRAVLQAEKLSLFGKSSEVEQELDARILDLEKKWMKIVSELRKIQSCNQLLINKGLKLLEIRKGVFKKTFHPKGYSRKGELTLSNSALFLNRSA